MKRHSVDKNLQHQQNMNNFEIAVVVLDAEKSKIEFLLGFLPEFKKPIGKFKKGKVYLIEK